MSSVTPAAGQFRRIRDGAPTSARTSRRTDAATAARVAVVLPGTGSDADFAIRAFGAGVRAAGLTIHAVEPDPTGVVRSYLAALDAAAARGARLVVCGISLGALVGLAWAQHHPGSVAGLALALPPWTGEPGQAPAARSALASAAALEHDGIDAVLAEVAASTPAWLSHELSRAWRRQWPQLPGALREAARVRGPELAALTALAVPLGVVGSMDDPVHPVDVARAWAAAAPRACLREVSLADIGSDPSVLGTAAMAGMRAAR